MKTVLSPNANNKNAVLATSQRCGRSRMQRAIKVMREAGRKKRCAPIEKADAVWRKLAAWACPQDELAVALEETGLRDFLRGLLRNRQPLPDKLLLWPGLRWLRPTIFLKVLWGGHLEGDRQATQDLQRLLSECDGTNLQRAAPDHPTSPAISDHFHASPVS